MAWVTAAASRSAVARPIPDEEPVTRVCLRAQFIIPPCRAAGNHLFIVSAPPDRDIGQLADVV
jgi:hypothetical protein